MHAKANRVTNSHNQTADPWSRERWDGSNIEMLVRIENRWEWGVEIRLLDEDK